MCGFFFSFWRKAEGGGNSYEFKSTCKTSIFIQQTEMLNFAEISQIKLTKFSWGQEN